MQLERVKEWSSTAKCTTCDKAHSPNDPASAVGVFDVNGNSRAACLRCILTGSREETTAMQAMNTQLEEQIVHERAKLKSARELQTKLAGSADAASQRAKALAETLREKDLSLEIAREGLEAKMGVIQQQHEADLRSVRNEATRAHNRMQREIEDLRASLRGARETADLHEACAIRKDEALAQVQRQCEDLKVQLLTACKNNVVLKKRAAIATALTTAISKQGADKQVILDTVREALEQQAGPTDTDMRGICVWKVGKGAALEPSRCIHFHWDDPESVLDVLNREGVVMLDVAASGKRAILEPKGRTAAELTFMRMLHLHDQESEEIAQLLRSTLPQFPEADAYKFAVHWGAADAASIPIPQMVLDEMVKERQLTPKQAAVLRNSKPRGVPLVGITGIDDLRAFTKAKHPVCLSKRYANEIINLAQQHA